MGRRLRKGDMVAVISGDDRGKRGRVLRVHPEENRVIVEGVNLVFRHLRRSQKNPQGGRIRREAPVNASNVMPIDPETNKPTRIKMGLEDDRRVRMTVHTGASIDVLAKGKSKSKKGGEDAASASED